MALAIFNPAIAPSPGSAMTPEISVFKSSFGDGYTQSSPKGLNHIRRTITLKWDVLTPAQASALNTFFTNQKGILPFYYTHTTDVGPRKYTCDDWSWTTGSPNSFSATIKESFTLAT